MEALTAAMPPARQESEPGEVSASDLDLLTTAWLRFPAFFRECARYVKPMHFEPNREPHYLVVWLVLTDLYAQYDTLTSETVLNAAFNLINSGQIMMLQEQIDEVLRQGEHGLITSAFMVDPAHIQLPYVRSLLQKFLNERTVLWPMRRITHRSNEPMDQAALGPALEQLSMQHRRITAVHGLPTREHAPPVGSDTASRARVLRPSGVSFVDSTIGGQRVGDVNAFLGFQGAGKSLFAGQLAVESGRQNFMRSREGVSPEIREEPMHSVLLTYEEPLDNVEPRLLSAAMEIDRTKLAAGLDWRTLTTMNNRATYERNYGSCELQRYEENREWFNGHVTIFDMSGSEDFPTAGTGGVNEIVSLLEALQQDTGCGIRTVVIDWAMPLVERQLSEKPQREDVLRRQLAALGDALRRQVAVKFSATVWITHQLKSDLSTVPTRLHKHTDAMECKSFCVHMPFCGALSYPDAATGVRRFHWPKHRNVAHGAVQPILLRPHSFIARFDDVSNRYTVDASAELIIETNAARPVLGPATA